MPSRVLALIDLTSFSACSNARCICFSACCLSSGLLRMVLINICRCITCICNNIKLLIHDVPINFRIDMWFFQKYERNIFPEKFLIFLKSLISVPAHSAHAVKHDSHIFYIWGKFQRFLLKFLPLWAVESVSRECFIENLSRTVCFTDIFNLSFKTLLLSTDSAISKYFHAIIPTCFLYFFRKFRNL